MLIGIIVERDKRQGSETMKDILIGACLGLGFLYLVYLITIYGISGTARKKKTASSKDFAKLLGWRGEKRTVTIAAPTFLLPKKHPVVSTAFTFFSGHNNLPHRRFRRVRNHTARADIT